MKYIVLKNKVEIGKSNTLAGIQSIIGISRKQFYNLRKQNAYHIVYRGIEYDIIDQEAYAWYSKLNEIMAKMEETNIMVHNALL